MAYNGSGTFNRLYNWVDDRDASVPITASRMDGEMDGMATGLSTAITKDGQTTITANLPMAGYRHTGVGNASARDDYASAGQIQDGSLRFAVGGGSANAQTVTLAPAITAYTDGMLLNFEAGATNTGNTTLNVNSVGAQSVVSQNGAELPAGAITSGRFYTVIYDLTNTNWVLVNPSVLNELDIITANTTTNVVDITADTVTTANVVDISADGLTTGSALSVTSNSADTSTRNLVSIVNDNTAATDTVPVFVQQDAADYCLHVEQNANADAIFIDSEATTANIVTISAPETSSGTCLSIQGADVLTTGKIAHFVSNSSSSSTRELVTIHNNHASSVATTCLELIQDSHDRALDIYKNNVGYAAYIDSEDSGIYITAASSTTTSEAGHFILSNNSATGDVIILDCHRAAHGGYSFLIGRSDTDSSADTEFDLSGSGNGFCDGSFTGGGADYAEFFEWEDGNPDNEDRRGISVELVGDKIRPATQASKVFGVISGNPSIVGDAAWNKWAGKYLRDDYGSYIMEDYEVWSWTGADEKLVSYASDKIPEGVEVPDEKEVVVQQRRKLNPEFDPSSEYVKRADRPEWDCVGLVGKLRVRKGQVTDPRWFKMRDVSDNVEEWMVK